MIAKELYVYVGEVSRKSSGNTMGAGPRAEMKDLTLPEDLIWTVPITPLEEQVPQPTRAPPQRIPILKYVSPRTRLVSPSSP